MFREGQALRPTKSEWDSAVLEGLCGERGCCPFAMVVEWKGSVQREERAPPLRKARGIVRFWKVMRGEGLLCNPSVLTAKSLINQKGGRIASKMQQSESLCLAVNPPPFNKGGKCDGAKQGIVRFWEGWWSNNPSGSRPNFFGRQHLTFNKGGKCDSALA